MLSQQELFSAVRILLKKYHAEYALLFGSYARGSASEDSDIDQIVVGGPEFKATSIFTFGEELSREMEKRGITRERVMDDVFAQWA